MQANNLYFPTDAYTSKSLVYEWQNSDAVTFVPGMTLSQFDLISMPQRNFTFTRREGGYPILFWLPLFAGFMSVSMSLVRFLKKMLADAPIQ